MSKKAKKWTIWILVAVCFIAVGAAIAVIAFAQAGFQMEDLRSEQNRIEKIETFESTEVKSIQIEPGTAYLTITGDNEKAGTIVYEEGEKDQWNISFEKDQVVITYQDTREWYERIGFYNAPKMEIYLPEERASMLQIQGGDGDVELQNIKFMDALTIEAGSGNIQISDTECIGAIIRTASGDIHLANFSTQEDLRTEAASGRISGKNIFVQGDSGIQSASGEIELDTMQIGGSGIFEAQSGDILLVNTTVQKDAEASIQSGDLNLNHFSVAGDIYMNGQSGDIQFEYLAGKNVEIKAESGEIRGSFEGDGANYVISAQSQSGDIDTPRTGTGDKIIELTTQSGDIAVTFAEKE